MASSHARCSPGQVRDAIFHVLTGAAKALSVKEIEQQVQQIIGPTPKSSIRSYLRLNTPELFVREDRGVYRSQQSAPPHIQNDLPSFEPGEPPYTLGDVTMFHADCFQWLEQQPANSFHAVVTDPPYGLHEYTPEQQAKLRVGKGGVWRIPPAFDGHKRSPLPRFTTLSVSQIEELRDFFFLWTRLLLPKLVPGAHVIVASNPLVSHVVAWALSAGGLERRGELIRLTMTMRGGDRPKAAHDEFPEVSVLPRSMWEPWLVYRKPIEGRVQDNLRKWKTGGFRRPSLSKPFGDVIPSAPTRSAERKLATHPSLKPQAFLRAVVRASLPLGEGLILDPFVGAGSTLAACLAVGYPGVGIEKDAHYFKMACKSIPKLTAYKGNGSAKAYIANSLEVF